MASGEQNQEERVPENLRRQLAVAVRSVQWSYAIFWTLSTREEGLLEWGDGYYNGDIRTRKTVQAMEFKADKMGLQRSEQLRELYECLLEGETDQQAKRPSAALSPDDLSNAEWYYLVCMSFVFSLGQGVKLKPANMQIQWNNQFSCLPGRAFANGQPIWLCNACSADSKVFSRSLLAKSASIQTVICFPHLGGVIELGITELVLEDPSLIQHIKTALLELSKPTCSEKSSSAPHYRDDDTDYMCAKVGHEIVNTLVMENFCSQTEDVKFDQEGPNEMEGNIQDDFSMGSPDDCSNLCEHNHEEDDSFLLEGIKDGTSQVQSWQFMYEDVSKGVQDSMNSSDCISQVFVNQEKVPCPPKTGNMNNNSLKELQECNHTKLGSLDLGADDDLHYKRTLSAVLRKSYTLLDNLCFRTCNFKSSFMSWKKGEIMKIHGPQVQQKMLKKILFNVPSMHGSCLLKPQQENGREDWLLKPEFNEICVKHAMPDKKMENEKFLVLKSMVPSISKIDKPSILGDTIEYLKVLEARIEELESCIDLADSESKGRRKHPDVVERTSENYENGRNDNGKKHPINKRKACDVDEDPELSSAVPTDGPVLEMKVKIKEQEVLIEMRCPWREYLLLDIMDAVNNLNLDAHTVQSSTTDGILTVTLHSKFRGASVASARMIKQTLSTIAGKC